jgi:hypothetical protein
LKADDFVFESQALLPVSGWMVMVELGLVEVTSDSLKKDFMTSKSRYYSSFLDQKSNEVERVQGEQPLAVVQHARPMAVKISTATAPISFASFVADVLPLANAANR